MNKIKDFFNKIFGKKNTNNVEKIDEVKNCKETTDKVEDLSDSTMEIKRVESTISETKQEELLQDDNELDSDNIEEETKEVEIAKETDKNTKQRAILIKPRNSRESKIIAKRLMENNIVVLNLKTVSDTDFERIRDFVSGTLFSLGGDYRKISSSIAVLLPTKEVDEEYLILVLEKAKNM